MVDLGNGQIKTRERGEGGDRGGEGRGGEWMISLFFCLLLSGNTQNDSNFKPFKCPPPPLTSIFS